MTTGLDPLDKYSGKTVQSRVYQLLKEAILSGKLQPDSRIRQSEVAGVLGVSVAPVREALHNLAADGMVRFDPHRGATVRSYELADFEEMIEIKLALEPARSRRLMANIQDDDIAALRSVHEAIVRDPDRYLELNPVFHDILSAASKAPQISGILHSLEDISTVMLSRTLHENPHRTLEGISEHARIIEALEEGDLEALTSVMIGHNQKTWDLARERLLAEAAGVAEL